MKRHGPDPGNFQVFPAENRLDAFEPLSGWTPRALFHASTSARDSVLPGATIPVT